MRPAPPPAPRDPPRYPLCAPQRCTQRLPLPPQRPGRAVCGHCALPLPTCLCRHIRPTVNHWPLLLLQHPQEAAQAKGSARLLRLGLAHCRLAVGEQFDDALLARWLDTLAPLAGGETALLLYPDAAGGAATAPSTPVSLSALSTLSDPSAPSAPGSPSTSATPRTLVLLDGSWRQARRLLQANPRLQSLQRWALPAPPPSRYLIRKAHRPAQRSTLEAACLALGTLEGRAAFYAPLLAGFDDWVAAVAARYASGGELALTSA